MCSGFEASGSGIWHPFRRPDDTGPRERGSRRRAPGPGHKKEKAAAEANAGTAGAPNVDAAGSIFTETQTLVKYEIMDGAPVKGEVIPVKLSLEGIPADLTPTYVGLSRFSVRYFLNLVLVDEDDRRYFKQQEIVLWRKELG